MKVPFEVRSKFEPAGDQPKAIEGLVDGLESGLAAQTLLGVTGSGLKALGFTEVQIGHEQGPPLGIPGGPLRQQLEGARAPAEVCARAQRWPITRW